jgi:hypothetical protein
MQQTFLAKRWTFYHHGFISQSPNSQTQQSVVSQYLPVRRRRITCASRIKRSIANLSVVTLISKDEEKVHVIMCETDNDPN